MYVRKATLEDLKDISRIYALSWKTAYRGQVNDAYLDELSLDAWVLPFTKWLAERDIGLYLCMDGNQPVGAAACFLSDEETYQGYGELQSIYVLPAYFHKGCGRLLIEAVEKSFLEKGISRYYLWVLRENTNAQEFYKNMGFSATEDMLEVEMAGDQLVDYRWVKVMR